MSTMFDKAFDAFLMEYGDEPWFGCLSSYDEVMTATVYPTGRGMVPQRYRGYQVICEVFTKQDLEAD